MVPWGGTEDLAGNKIILQLPPTSGYSSIGNELYLNRDVMDKQVIDTNGFRVVRVNDLELAKIGDDYRLVNVDIGGRGLLRRLGWEDFSITSQDVCGANCPRTRLRSPIWISFRAAI